MNKMWSPRYLLLFIVLVVAVLLPWGLSSYQVNVLVLVCLYAVLAESWNIVGGYAGQGSFFNAAFFGVCAYASSLLYIIYGITPWFGMLVGTFLAVILAVGVGYLCFRFGLTGHFFFLASIGLLVAIQRTFVNIYWSAHGKPIGGAYGLWIPVVRGNSILDFQFESRIPYYYIILIVLLAEIYITYRIQKSKMGYYFRAIKDNEDAAESLGINTLKYKIIAFAISGALAAPAGTFYAQYYLFINPGTVLSDMLSIQMVVIAVIGGMGTIFGPVIGAIIVQPIMEYARVFLGAQRGIDLIVTGIIIIAIATLKPTGFIEWFERAYNYVTKHMFVTRSEKETEHVAPRS